MQKSDTVGGGHQKDVTTSWPPELDLGSWRVLTPPLSLECMFAYHSLSGSSFQGHSLGRAVCCWDHVGSIVKPSWGLYKTFKMLEGAEFYLSCPRLPLYVTFLLKTAIYPIWSGWPLLSLLILCIQGLVSGFTQGTWVCEPTIISYIISKILIILVVECVCKECGKWALSYDVG